MTCIVITEHQTLTVSQMQRRKADCRIEYRHVVAEDDCLENSFKKYEAFAIQNRSLGELRNVEDKKAEAPSTISSQFCDFCWYLIKVLSANHEIIHSKLQNQKTIKFIVFFCVIRHTVVGDADLAYVPEIQLASNGG